MTLPSSVTLHELSQTFSVDTSELAAVAERYPFRISRHYASLIQGAHDPIWLQAVPSSAELEDTDQQPDPLDEERLSPVPGLIHRYPDRVVLLPFLREQSLFVFVRRPDDLRQLPYHGAAVRYVESQLAPAIHQLQRVSCTAQQCVQ